MARVFFSHSKNDRRLINYFSNIFTNIGLQGMFYEWQRAYDQYAGEIITNIICHPNTSALFVLLGPALQDPNRISSSYTHNWVSFEVGVAAGCGKPIWVFEEFGSSIRYPVPLVTDYAQYTPGSIDHLQYYGAIFLDRMVSQTFRIQLLLYSTVSTQTVMHGIDVGVYPRVSTVLYVGSLFQGEERQASKSHLVFRRMLFEPGYPT